MLSDHCESVLQAKSPDAFKREVVKFAEEIGFDFVSAVTVLVHSSSHPEVVNVDNTPPEWAAAYRNLDMVQVDPVLQHCRYGSLPIIWNQDTYVKNGAGHLWEEQAPFGYRNGIALAMHMPGGRQFVMGVDRREAIPDNPRDRTRLVADLQLFAVHAQDTALRLFVSPERQPERPGLTQRELEALRWTMEGKTAWEVGGILGITERTAVLHLQNAMRKLGATSKHQAVLRALRLGLIH